MIFCAGFPVERSSIALRRRGAVNGGGGAVEDAGELHAVASGTAGDGAAGRGDGVGQDRAVDLERDARLGGDELLEHALIEADNLRGVLAAFENERSGDAVIGGPAEGLLDDAFDLGVEPEVLLDNAVGAEGEIGISEILNCQAPEAARYSCGRQRAARREASKNPAVYP